MAADGSWTGRVVGDYEVRQELGRGGMGVVYAALERSLQRPVALKALHEELVHDPGSVRRFLREARLMAQLNHPNIARMFKVSQLEDTYVIAMEYVRGLCLARLLNKRGALDERRALDIARQIAGALAAAHRQGVIHGDIKPHNIIINQAGHVKVIDFGLARLQHSASLATRTGGQLGSPFYISPEQCEGKPTDGRTDVYSLGVTLFEMASGRVPFNGDSPLAIMYQVCSEGVPDLSSVKPDASPHLSRVVSLMTARSPDDRYPSAESVHADLEACLQSGMAPFADEKARDSVLGDLATTGAPRGDTAQPPATKGTPAGRHGRGKGYLWPAVVTAALACSLTVWLVAMGATSSSPTQRTVLDEAPPVQAESPPVSEAERERVLTFPGNKAFGTLFVQDEREREILTDTAPYGLARGTVAIPAGTSLGLKVHGLEVTDLSWLRDMPADAFQGLWLDRMPARDEDLADVALQRTLWALYVESDAITDAGVRHLTNLPALRNLSLHKSGITDAGLAALAEATDLEELSVDESMRITDDGIACIGRMQSLSLLSLDGCTQITDSGIAHLSGLTHVEHLYISGVQITGNGLRALGGIAGLKRLYLYGTPITDADLASLPGFTGLHTLSLGRTRITDAALSHLERLTALRTLKVHETSVTDAGAARLAQALPNCDIMK